MGWEAARAGTLLQQTHDSCSEAGSQQCCSTSNQSNWAGTRAQPAPGSLMLGYVKPTAHKFLPGPPPPPRCIPHFAQVAHTRAVCVWQCLEACQRPCRLCFCSCRGSSAEVLSLPKLKEKKKKKEALFAAAQLLDLFAFPFRLHQAVNEEAKASHKLQPCRLGKSLEHI